LNKKKLFILPFAGRNKFSFKEFHKFLESDFNIVSLELPGRGERFSENLITDMDTALNDLFTQIQNKLDCSYYIYGHSLGGLFAYLLTLKIEEKNLATPKKIIISGRAHPTKNPTSLKHTLPKTEFATHLRTLGGIPEDFFKHPELFDLFEPVLRADYKLVESFNHQENKKLSTKLSILYGSNESFSISEAKKWREFSSHESFHFQKFDGNHFFIYNHIEAICKIIRGTE